MGVVVEFGKGILPSTVSLSTIDRDLCVTGKARARAEQEGEKVRDEPGAAELTIEDAIGDARGNQRQAAPAVELLRHFGRAGVFHVEIEEVRARHVSLEKSTACGTSTVAILCTNAALVVGRQSEAVP